MVFGKYTRLPSKDPEFSELKFDALDGPSYFSYGGQQGKYRSVFTYSSLNSASSQPEERKQTIGCIICHRAVTSLCYLIFVITLPLSLLFTLKTVRSFEKIVLFRLGRYLKVVEPGYVVVLPCIDSWKRVDMRMKAFGVPPQKVITADNAVIEMGAEIFYNVVDPLKSVNSIQDLNHSTRIISQISLQKCLGRKNLSEIETSRQSILDVLKEDVNESTKLWGVEVTKVELSAPKLYSKPNHLANQANNPLSFLGPVLFPPGASNPPIEQLQHYFNMASKELTHISAFAPEPKSVASPTQSNANRFAGKLMHSVEEMIQKVTPRLNSNLVKDFGLLYKFVITLDAESDESATFYLDLKKGEGQAGKGYPFANEADVVMTMKESILQNLMSGKMSPFDAFMSGELSVSGYLKGAMKLGTLVQSIRNN